MKKSKKNISIDDLAVMVAGGFEAMQGQFDGMQDQFGSMKKDIGELKQGQGDLKKDIHELKQGQEDIKLKLDNVAYRFELVELQRRVELLEKKVGMRP